MNPTPKYTYTVAEAQDVMCVTCGGQAADHPDGRPRLY